MTIATAPITGADWYDNLTDQDRELYEMIEDMCTVFRFQEFMDELREYGITTAEQFESAYFWQSDSYKAEAEFSEYVATEINCVDIPDYIFSHIDWQSMWDCELHHYYFTIEFDSETYFFNNNF